MKRTILLVISLLLIISLVSVSLVGLELTKRRNPFPDVFAGVMVAYGDVNDAKMLIDKIKDFSNLLVIDTMETIKNRTKLDEVCNYAYDAGLYFFVFMYPSLWRDFDYIQSEWIEEAENQYGNKFLGIYLFDEPGGNQLDQGSFRQFVNATDYQDATNTYIYYLFACIRDFIKTERLVTSDYALYWFDYEAGYDTIFCEFGWNNTRELHVALCRGAAKMHNKDWGVMVTWTYNGTPYMDSGVNLYNDMVSAYLAGAKYILTFNYPKIGPYGVLTEEHFDAMRDFKEYISQNRESHGKIEGNVAYVLPEDYGWKFQSLDDKVWGLWNADENSQEILDDINSLVQKYGYEFDIIYNSVLTRILAKGRSEDYFDQIHYSNLIYWDGRIEQIPPS